MMEQLQEKYHKLIDMYSSKEFKVDVTKPDKNFNIFLTDLYLIRYGNHNAWPERSRTHLINRK